jgi:hypothetical protein
MNWEPIIRSFNIDEKINLLNANILHLFNKHAPLRTVRVTHPPAPWLTTEIRDIMRERDMARRRFCRSKRASDYDAFRRLRNRAKQLVRNAKLRYSHDLFGKCSNTGDVWRTLRRLRVHGKGNEQQPLAASEDELNLYFTSAPAGDDADAEELVQAHNGKPLPHHDPFHFRHVHFEDITKAITKITSQARGEDQIPGSFLKKLMHIITPILYNIFNFSLQYGRFPDLWKKALVRPLAKTSRPSSPSDYRPISLLCVLSKVLERIVYDQVVEYLGQFNYFDPLQSGFRPCHSTTTALLRVTDDIRLAMDRREVTVLVLFDFSKAFDSVIHDVLLAKLRALNFSQSAMGWFGSYLCGRRQRVLGPCLASSGWSSVANGVPQGSVLGPLLFSIYIHDMADCLKHCRYHLYADDLQVYLHCRVQDLPRYLESMNEDVASLYKWSMSHGLRINENKTKPMIVGYTRLLNTINLNTIPRVVVNGVALEFVGTAKNLGIIFNNTLTWPDHVASVCGRVFSLLRQFRRNNVLAMPGIRAFLVRSLVFPIFDYGCLVYGDLTGVLGLRLQRAQNACVRYVFDLRYDEHVSPYYRRLNWMRLETRRAFFLGSAMFGIMSTDCPSYLRDSFNFMSSTRSRQTRLPSHYLQIPIHRTSIFNKSFTCCGIRLWNSLPSAVVGSVSLPLFKKRLYDYLKTMEAS